MLTECSLFSKPSLWTPSHLMLCCIESFEASSVFFLFSSKCHVSLFTEKWKCMRQVERFAPVLVTRWRIRHPCQQCRSVGLPINERIWVSLPKSERKKKHRCQVLPFEKQTYSPQRHLDSNILARNTEQSVYNVAFVQETNKTDPFEKWVFFLISHTQYLYPSSLCCSFLNLIPWEVARIHMRCLGLDCTIHIRPKPKCKPLL